MPETRMVAATGMLGYGFSEAALAGAMDCDPHFIASDAGSMDPGPYYLGSGTAFVSRAAAKRDLGLILEAGVRNGVPVLIGSAGGGGGQPHVDWTREIAEEIAAEKGLSFRMAVIQSEQPKPVLRQAVADGQVRPLGPIDELTEDEVEASSRVVAMMGVEPYQQALEDGAQVVIAGRSSDAALYAAVPLMRGADPGLAWHCAKIVECAGQVVHPRNGQDCVVGIVRDDDFLIQPGHPDKVCPRYKVAAHTLYENPSPYHLVEPEGTLDTTEAGYEQHDARTVRVFGSRFLPSNDYTVKLEGVRSAGYRTVFMAGVRDPVLIAGLDDFVASCRERVADEIAPLGIAPDSYRIGVKIYGRDAVMGAREPMAEVVPHEVGILVDVLADSEDASKAVMAKMRYALLHTDFPGRMCISGNLAIPFSPSDMPVGETYRFNVWHVWKITDPLAPFPIEMVNVG